MLDDNFTEISPDMIEEVEKTLKSGFCDYKIKDSQFNAKTFEKGEDIVLIQIIGDEEIELTFSS